MLRGKDLRGNDATKWTYLSVAVGGIFSFSKFFKGIFGAAGDDLAGAASHSADEAAETTARGTFAAPRAINFVGSKLDDAATQAALSRMAARIKNLKAGAAGAVDGVQAFGSRAGSTFRGRGAHAGSDIDIFINGSKGLKGSRHQKNIERKLLEIADDFTSDTGIPVQLVPDWLLTPQRAGEILSSGPTLPL